MAMPFLRTAIILSSLFVLMFPEIALAQTQPNTEALISCWNMDETISTRIDHQGVNNLADFNTTSYSTGLISNAAALVQANNEYLEVNHNSNLIPANFTVLTFVNTSTTGSYQAIVFKGGGVSNNDNTYALRFQPNNSVGFYVGTGSTFDNLFNSETANDGSWHMIAGSFSDASDIIKLTVDSTVISDTSTVSPVVNSGAFSVGKSYIGGTIPSFNGAVDVTAFYNYLLSDDELAWVYNSGDGRSCEELAGTDAAISEATVYITELPSGGTAVFSMDASAGQIFIAIGIALIVLLLTYDRLRQWSRSGKVR